jgi:two-component system, NarL family, nitrate/nitrite response regulator NarL
MGGIMKSSFSTADQAAVLGSERFGGESLELALVGRSRTEESEMSTSTVMVACHNNMMAQLTSSFVDSIPGLTAVATTTTVDGAIEGARTTQPSVVLVSDDFARTESAETVRRIRAAAPAALFVMLSQTLDYETVHEAVTSGYSSFVTTFSKADDLVVALRAAAAGVTHFTREVITVLTGPVAATTTAGGPLSTREREVLQLLAAGASTSAISATLFISSHTVRNHVRHILGKLNAKSKLEALLTARQMGLVALTAQPADRVQDLAAATG